jgi:uncharacterized protein (TIGR03086 family)
MRQVSEIASTANATGQQHQATFAWIRPYAVIDFRTAPARSAKGSDLIDHVDVVSRGATALARHAALPETDAGHLDPHWRDSVTRHVRELGEAWDDPRAWQGSANVPGSDLSNEMWGKITLTELIVHGWDIARATGQSFDLPEHTLQACLDQVATFVPNAPVPALWGPPVDVAPGATLLDRIVAITGRAP